MTRRLDYNQVAPNGAKALGGVYGYVLQSGLPGELVDLVYLRVSQINNCAYCLDMHTRELLKRGVKIEKLALVQAWEEGGSLFSEAERAALELTEQGTRLADAAEGVSDDAWLNAAKHYDEVQLGALMSLIAVINAFNRLNVITQQPAGDYVVGQFG